MTEIFTPADPGTLTVIDLADYVNVSRTAADLGFIAPVYVSPAVFDDAVAWDDDAAGRKPQAAPTNAQTRLMSLLTPIWFIVAACGPGAVVPLTCERVTRQGAASAVTPLALTVRIHPGPLVTVDVA